MTRRRDAHRVALLAGGADSTLDYLFVGEAGQVSLADALAMGTATRQSAFASHICSTVRQFAVRGKSDAARPGRSFRNLKDIFHILM